MAAPSFTAHKGVYPYLERQDARIFRRWEGQPGQKYTFNSTELRHINVSMQLQPPVGGTPLNIVQQEARTVPRRAAAQQADAQRVQQLTNPLRAAPKGVTTAVHKQMATPPDLLWEVPTGDERRILDMCCP